MPVHCLHIGINDYAGGQHDLAGCVNDAVDCRQIFGRRHKGTRRDRYDECRFFGKAASQVTLLDRQATRARVLDELRTLLKKLARGDLGIFTFSGHGTYVHDASGDERDGYDEALVCADLEVIVDDELSTLFERRAVGSRLVVATDACHSGTNVRTIGPRLAATPNPHQRQRFLHPGHIPLSATSNQRGVKLQTSPKLVDVIHFAACGDRQFAADAEFHGRPNGAYTFEWLQALCRLPAGATYRAWRDEVRLPNQEFTQAPQTNAFARALDWKLPTR